MPVILLFILILNIVSILIIYYSLGNLDKKEKLIYIVVGVSIMYILTSIVYGFSTKEIEISEVSERGKDFIIFIFVPINSILILPILAKSYKKFKHGSLDKSILQKRGIVLAIVFVVILIIECNYFKNIQEQVVNMLKEQQNNQQNNMENIENSNIMSNELNGNNTVTEIMVNNTDTIEKNNMNSVITINETVEN